MCATFDTEKGAKLLAFLLTGGISAKALEEEWKTRVVPYAKAPILVDGELELAQFCLTPSWSPTQKVKFATYNARLDTILEKKTWQGPFVKKHCVVPVARFVEPIYTGKLAGNMVAFKAPELLLAAGIYSDWKNPESKEVTRTFAIVTDDPSDYVKDIGHDRQPVFLGASRAKEWMGNENEDGKELQIFLREVAEEPNFSTEIDRPMAKGWEKRIPKD